MNWTNEEISRVLQTINRKAKIDLDFRNLCLNHPNEAIKQVSGKEVPSGLRVRFIENNGAHFTHVLPDYIESANELSESELEQVSAAGGKDDQVSCPQCGSTNCGTTHVLYARYHICRDCGWIF